MATLNANVCANVNATTVQEIIDTDLTDAQIAAFVNMSYYMTLPLVGHLGSCGGGDALCNIQLILSAHFITMFERQTVSENVAGEWAVTYLGVAGQGLSSSLYGQQAIALDCSGKLAKAGLKRASFGVTSYRDLEASEFDITR